MLGRMPVARGEDRQLRCGESFDPAVERRDDGVTVANGELAAGKKVLLYVDDQQRVAGLKSGRHRSLLSVRPKMGGADAISLA